MQNNIQTKIRASSPGYETKDANPRNIMVFVLLLFVTVLLSFAALTALFHAYERQAALKDERARQPLTLQAALANRPYFPYPREQPSPPEDLKTLLAQANAELNSYGRIDRKAGVVRIPISRAMELIVERGLPTRASGRSVAGKSELELQQERARNAETSNKEVQ